MFLASTPDIGDVISKLIPKFWPFMIQLTAFIILFIAVFFLAYKPVKKFLKKRNDYVNKNIEESKKNEEKSLEKLKEIDNKLNESYKEAKKIVSDAKKDANVIKEQIVQEAKEEAKLELEKAKVDIENEVKKNKENIHKEMVDIALLASSKILEREVSTKDNEKRVDSFIKDLKKDN